MGYWWFNFIVQTLGFKDLEFWTFDLTKLLPLLDHFTFIIIFSITGTDEVQMLPQL